MAVVDCPQSERVCRHPRGCTALRRPLDDSDRRSRPDVRCRRRPSVTRAADSAVRRARRGRGNRQAAGYRQDRNRSGYETLRYLRSLTEERPSHQEALTGDHRQMNRRSTRIAAAAVLGLLAAASGSSAQSLANRVGSAGDRAVQFSYKARPGVCGDGRTYISTAAGNFFGSYSSSNSEACQAGPVRVVLDLADRNVVALRTFVGNPETSDASVTNLGSVTPVEAAEYLLGVAARADGRVGRDAIFAA